MLNKNSEYIVVKKYRTEFDNPISLIKGEKVILGEESGTIWTNWILCTKIDGSNKGWVPKQIINILNEYGEIIEDYSAKELDVDIGTFVIEIKELNGWLWVKNKNTNEIGWLPMENLKKIN